MDIVIRRRNGTLVATVNKVTACVFTEKLSTVKTLSFETVLNEALESIADDEQYVVTFQNDYYDVVKIKKSLSNGLYFISFECEHISYRLSEEALTDFTCTGTPRVILAELLRGTVFSIGVIQPTVETTFTVTSSTTKRAAILAFCNTIGCDADFVDYRLNVYNHRGSVLLKDLVERNMVSVSKTTDKTDSTNSYTCTVRSPAGLNLGDEVHFRFTKLGIDDNVRVIGMKTQPFTSEDAELEVDHYSPSIESQFAQIETDMVAKDKNYYGAKISADSGLTVTRSDGTAKVILNADEFRMQAENDQGHLEDRLYFDPVTGDYRFVGTVKIDGGEINIGNNFRVDQHGNAYLAGDATIYGGKYYAGNPDEGEGFSEMTARGFEVYNGQTDIKLRFGYTSQGEDFPFIQLGSGSGEYTDYGLVKKFTDGLWIGNSEPSDESGNFTAKTGYNGIFFKFSNNTAYIVQNTTMKNIYTGAAIAKFA